MQIRDLVLAYGCRCRVPDTSRSKVRLMRVGCCAPGPPPRTSYCTVARASSRGTAAARESFLCVAPTYISYILLTGHWQSLATGNWKVITVCCVHCVHSKGPPKNKKPGTPLVGGRVRGQKRTKV
jgi:hypothetical protein